jgi:hypothetical protein
VKEIGVTHIFNRTVHELKNRKFTMGFVDIACEEIIDRNLWLS